MNPANLQPMSVPASLLNRTGSGDFRLPPDNWYHLAPKGEFPHRETGLVQVLDERALSAMVERFQTEARQPNFPGLLVDFDHFSYDPQQASAAAGWMTALEQRADGLWAQIRWSEAGAAALKAGRYRLISPAWLARDCETLPERPALDAPQTMAKAVRPLRLDSAGLTNSPNFKGLLPLSNRAPAAGSAPASFSLISSNHKPKTKGNMQHICQVLGLTPDTAESAVTAAVSQWLERAKAAEAALAPLKNRVAELEKDNAALVESQVEADLEKYAPRFAAEKRDSWKKALLANRAGTIELLESLPEPPCGAVQYAQAHALAHDHVHDQKTPPIHNRATARHPASVNGLTADPVGRAEEQRKAVLEYKNRCRCTWQEAWDALKTERPEMFHENS